MTLNVASDLGLHCLPTTLLRISREEWVKTSYLGFISNVGCNNLNRSS